MHFIYKIYIFNTYNTIEFNRQWIITSTKFKHAFMQMHLIDVINYKSNQQIEFYYKINNIGYIDML